MNARQKLSPSPRASANISYIKRKDEQGVLRALQYPLVQTGISVSFWNYELGHRMTQNSIHQRDQSQGTRVLDPSCLLGGLEDPHA